MSYKSGILKIIKPDEYFDFEKSKYYDNFNIGMRTSYREHIPFYMIMTNSELNELGNLNSFKLRNADESGNYIDIPLISLELKDLTTKKQLIYRGLENIANIINGVYYYEMIFDSGIHLKSELIHFINEIINNYTGLPLLISKQGSYISHGNGLIKYK